MFKIKFSFPSSETLDCNRCKSCKFRSFEKFLFFLDNFGFDLISFSFDKKINYPKSYFFNNIINNRLISIFIDKIFNSFSNCVEIISCDTSYWFNIVLDWCFRICFSVFEMNWELIFELEFRKIWSDQDGKFVWNVLFGDMELIKINVRQNFKLILLNTLTLKFCLSGWNWSRLRHFQ